MRAGWTTAPLGEVAQIAAGNSAPQAASLFIGGAHPFFRTADAGRIRFGDVSDSADHLNDAGIKGLRRFPAGTILFPKSGASTFLNHRVMLSVPGYVSSHLATITADAARLDPRFLLYFLSTVRAQDLVQDHAYPSLNRSTIAAIPISYPSLAEQRRVAAVLDEVSGAIATARANAAKNAGSTQALYESHLQAVFNQRGREWERVTLETLLERGWIESHLDGNHGGDYPRKQEFIDDGVPYISANCIVDESVDMTRAKHLSPQRAALLRKGIAKDGDVLFAHNATVGPVAILRTEEEQVILGTSLTYYRCNRQHIMPEYLAHYMRSFGFKSQYQQVMRQSTRNQVPITKQREFFHVIPPLTDQKTIVSQLDGLFEAGQELAGIYSGKLVALDALKRAILREAFEGQLNTAP